MISETLADTFLILFETRSMTETSLRLDVSRQAVSKRIKDIEKEFGCPELFVADTRGQLAPTPAAELLFPSIQDMKAIKEQLRSQLGGFEREKGYRFKLAAAEFAEKLILPKVYQLLREESPASVMEIQPLWNRALRIQDLGNLKNSLASGEADFAIFYLLHTDELKFREVKENFGTTELEQGDFHMKTLLEEDMVCMCHKDAEISDPVTLEEYLAKKHILIDPRLMGMALPEGSDRDMAVLCSSLGQLACFIENDEHLICSPPRHIAKDASNRYGVRWVELPPEVYSRVPRLTLNLLWHRRVKESPAHQWFRDLLDNAVNSAIK